MMPFSRGGGVQICRVTKVEGPVFKELVKVNTVSLLAQIVQAGAFPAVIPLILIHRNADPYLIGVISSIPWLTVLVAAPLVSAVINRLDMRRTTLLGLMITLLSLVIVFILDHTVQTLSVSVFLMGLGMAFRWISCDTWIVLLAKPSSRGRVIGFHESLMGLGIGMGPLTLVYGHTDMNLYCIFLSLLIVCASGVVLFAKLPDATSAISLSCSGLPLPERKRSVSFLHVIPIMSVTVFAAVVSGFIETSSLSFLPAFLAEKSFEDSRALIYLTVFGLGGTLLQLPLGYLSDRVGIKVSLFCAALLVILGAGYCILWIGSTVSDMPVLFLWGGSVGGLTTLAVIQAGTQGAVHDISKRMAVIASSYTTGSMLGPLLCGFAWEMGSEDYIMMLFMMLSALFVAFLCSGGRIRTFLMGLNKRVAPTLSDS